MKRKQKEALVAYFEAPKPEKKQAFLRQFGQPKMNLWHITAMQARYISKWVWIFSVFFFGVIFWAAQTMEQRYVNMVLGFVPFLVMLSVTESTRSLRYGMEELEMSTRFSLKSVIMARMVVLGLGNVAVLTGAMLILNSQVQMNPVYLMTPYFVTAGGGLYIVRSVRGKDSNLLCFALAAIVCVAMLCLPWKYHSVYMPQNAWIWACVCVAGVVMTIRESVRTIRMTEELV